jgi:transmembrane sensor
MNNSRLMYLYQQYIANDCTVEELQELEVLLKNPAHQQEFMQLLDGTWSGLKPNELKDIESDKAEDIYSSIINKDTGSHFKLNFWMRIAAAVLVMLSIGLVFYTHSGKQKLQIALAKVQHSKQAEIMPGSNKAILTLGNGKKVMLNGKENGHINTKAGMLVNSAAGQLSYSASPAETTEENSLAIPKGGQYHLTLPDGTQVYLNSSSTLSYPTRFSGNSRQVTLRGEAYFEVAKNPKMPFIVNLRDQQQIEVLGTHFNVKAYADDKTINTTLLEGSVKILANRKQVVIKPGQVAITSQSSPISVERADLEEVMAWTNGMFIFNNENITSIMKKVARWYDVEVVFTGNMDNVNFIGNYSRSKSLTNLLKNIELMDKVHFSTSGRRVTVIAN